MSSEDAMKAEENYIKKLEEDDEFEDFPEDDWTEADTVGANQENHLWEESWEDHDDDKDDFTNTLRYVL